METLVIDQLDAVLDGVDETDVIQILWRFREFWGN
jgi:hypothetical protein